MIGDIILRLGNYVETIMKESGSTRLVFCFDFRPELPEDQHPLTVRHYRIEYWQGGTIQNQTVTDIAEAVALFYERIGGKPEDLSRQKRLFSRELSDRIDKHLCIHCGTSENVVKALCTPCRKLPRFQQVLGS